MKRVKCSFQGCLFLENTPKNTFKSNLVFGLESKGPKGLYFIRELEKLFSYIISTFIIFVFCAASHLVAVLPRIDERQDDDFFRSASDSDSFSSDEDNVPAPDLREAKKKPKNQEESHIQKTSKHVTEPVVSKPPPVPTPRESEVQEDVFIAVKAENLFDISEGEDDKQVVAEELENEKFFDPDDKSDNSESEDEEENSRTQGKKRREEAENSSESEEEEKDEEEETEGGKRAAVTKNGSDNLKLVTTAMTSFKKAAGRKTKDQEFGAEEQDKEEEKMEEERKVEEQEKEDESGENEVEQEKDVEEAAPEKEEEEEEEDEPRVEFTGDTKPEVRSFLVYRQKNWGKRSCHL